MVPEWLKVTNDPEFTKYAHENYIIDDDKICDDDAKGYFADASLPSDTFLIICRMTSQKTIMGRARDIILSMKLMQKTTMTLFILFAMFLRQAMMKAPSRAL
jgi:hypothetical protein